MFFQNEQADIVFPQIELLIQHAVLADFHGNVGGRSAAVRCLDLCDLRFGQLGGRTQVQVGRVGVVDTVADFIQFQLMLPLRHAGQVEFDSCLGSGGEIALVIDLVDAELRARRHTVRSGIFVATRFI